MEQVSTPCPELRQCFWRIILMSDSCKPGGQRWGFRNTDFFFIFWESLGVVSLMMSQGGPVCPWMSPSSHTFLYSPSEADLCPGQTSWLATMTTSVHQPRWCGVPRVVPFLIPETHAFFHWLGRSIWDVKTTLFSCVRRSSTDINFKVIVWVELWTPKKICWSPSPNPDTSEGDLIWKWGLYGSEDEIIEESGGDPNPTWQVSSEADTHGRTCLITNAEMWVGSCQLRNTKCLLTPSEARRRRERLPSWLKREPRPADLILDFGQILEPWDHILTVSSHSVCGTFMEALGTWCGCVTSMSHHWIKL